MPRLKNSKEAQKLRNELLKKQDNIDPIAFINVTDAVLDHQHYGPFKCRAVLQREVNSFEGKVYNAYRRYIKHLKSNLDLPGLLRSLASYLEQDYSNMPVHYTGIIDEVRVFKRINSEKQIKVLKELGIEPAQNAKKRIKQIRKALLENKITYEGLQRKVNEKA